MLVGHTRVLCRMLRKCASKRPLAFLCAGSGNKDYDALIALVKKRQEATGTFATASEQLEARSAPQHTTHAHLCMVHI